MAIKTPAPGPVTLADYGMKRLSSLARVAGLEAQIDSMQRFFREALGVWGRARVDEPPPWASDVCDDHAPFEFSIAVDGGRPELRVLVEARGEPATLRSNLTAGKRLNAWIEREFGAELGRLRAIEGLFDGPDVEGPFVYWHAVSFAAGKAPEFKLYLNLMARGRAHAAALAEASLARLGFEASWPAVVERAMSRGPALDIPTYLALDLTAHKPRLKLYFRHIDARLEDLERACSVARNWVPGRASEFCSALLGPGPYTAKGAMTCLAFVEGDVDRPGSSTIYCPVGAYASDDRAARDRVTGYLARQGLPINAYAGCLEALATRPLEAGTGLQSYASLKWGEGPKVTVYLAPEVYGAATPRPAPPEAAPAPPRAPEPPVAVVRHHEATPITAHPFFARLAREPADVRRLYALLANFREGIVLDFPRRLAALTARVGDDRVRCVLAKQLNDELGDGDFARAHRGLFERMLTALSPFRPEGVGEAFVAPGRELGRELERLYVEADPDEGVGASLVVEIYGKQVDGFVAEQFRRQRDVGPDALEWLNLHENLEVDHADESTKIALLLPAGGPACEAVGRGAASLAAASWRFFDAMYRVCFP
jgi:DMATS type aromatic prenyltransferase